MFPEDREIDRKFFNAIGPSSGAMTLASVFLMAVSMFLSPCEAEEGGVSIDFPRVQECR